MLISVFILSWLYWLFRHGDFVRKSASVIDPDKTVNKRAKIKPLAVKAGYPWDRMVLLWNLISITKMNSQI